MRKNIEEKISMLVDDELSSQEAIALLEKIGKDQQLQELWYRYNKISLILKSEGCVRVDSQFPNRVKENIELVPTVLLAKSRYYRTRKWAFALAASAAFVAVLFWLQIFSKSQIPVEPMLVAQPSLPSIEAPDLAGQYQELDSRLSDYLVTHTESAYSAGMQGMLPYARVVSYTDE